MSIAYSTMPRALRGASSMSWMTAFWRSRGSTSPNARPTSLSYGPTVPNDAPPKVGDSTRVISMRVIRASAVPAPAPSTAAMHQTSEPRTNDCVFIVILSLHARCDRLVAQESLHGAARRPRARLTGELFLHRHLAQQLPCDQLRRGEGAIARGHDRLEIEPGVRELTAADEDLAALEPGIGVLGPPLEYLAERSD